MIDDPETRMDVARHRRSLRPYLVWLAMAGVAVAWGLVARWLG